MKKLCVSRPTTSIVCGNHFIQLDNLRIKDSDKALSFIINCETDFIFIHKLRTNKGMSKMIDVGRYKQIILNITYPNHLVIQYCPSMNITCPPI